jgi:hypothetical protein
MSKRERAKIQETDMTERIKPKIGERKRRGNKFASRRDRLSSSGAKSGSVATAIAERTCFPVRVSHAVRNTSGTNVANAEITGDATVLATGEENLADRQDIRN